MQHLGNPRLGGIAINLAVTGMQVTDRLAVTGRFRSGKFALDPAQFDVAIEHEVDRRIRERGRFLGDAGDTPGRRQFDVAGLGVQLVGEQGKEAGLPAAVGADDADFPAGMELDRGSDDQRAAGAGEGDLAEGNHEAADYSGVLLKSAHLITLHHGRSVMSRGRYPLLLSLDAASLIVCALLPGLAWSAGEASTAATIQELEWEQRLERAGELQRRGAAGKAAAEKQLDEQSAGCYLKFLVNRCLDNAQSDYLVAYKDARRIENEGKAIERQVKKEQFAAREAKWAAEAPEREAGLQAREAETAAERAETQAEEAAKRESKARKAEEGAQRKAEDAERLRRKQADHEARVARQVEKANAKAAVGEPAKP